MKLIPLTFGKYAMVDDEDYEKLSAKKWHARESHSTTYAVRSPKKRCDNLIIMHREIILSSHSDLQVDHIDGNGLNNQKYNLRLVTRSQNCRNQQNKKGKTSIYPGVSKTTTGRPWQARIVVGQVGKFLGKFDSEFEAFLAYKKAVNAIGEECCLSPKAQEAIALLQAGDHHE